MDSPNTSKIDRINNDISKLEQLADKGKFDCNRYVRTNSQCTELEGKKTRDMYKKMLSLLVALSNSVKLGNHMAAEGIRIVYNAECGGNFKINADRAFATLEEGAFRTKWSASMQQCISKALNLDDHARIDYRTRRNKDRMHELASIYSLTLASNEDSSFNARALVAITVYVNKYPSAKEFLPDNLYVRIFPEEFKQKQEKESQLDKRQE